MLGHWVSLQTVVTKEVHPLLFKLINMYRTIILPVILCGSNIDSYRKFWGDNLLRMDGLRISKIAYEYNPKGRRNVGHPRNRWAL
jgi:hypothetical protein